jgi:hypothetical protein
LKKGGEKPLAKEKKRRVDSTEEMSNCILIPIEYNGVRSCIYASNSIEKTLLVVSCMAYMQAKKQVVLT